MRTAVAILLRIAMVVFVLTGFLLGGLCIAAAFLPSPWPTRLLVAFAGVMTWAYALTLARDVLR